MKVELGVWHSWHELTETNCESSSARSEQLLAAVLGIIRVRSVPCPDLPRRKFPSPLSVRSPVTIAPEVHTEYGHTNKHRAANHDPLRQVGIHNRIQNSHQKRTVCGFDACASFKPRFSDGERT